MNCYNGEYLAEAVKIILFQTYTNWELIFWDNQSTDNSSTIVNSYGDSRIRYFYAPSHLIWEKLGTSLYQKQRRWIGFIDVDDVWFKDKLQLQIKKFGSQKYNLVYSRCEFFYDKVVFQVKKKSLLINLLGQGGDYLRVICQSYIQATLFHFLLFFFQSVLLKKLAVYRVGICSRLLYRIGNCFEIRCLQTQKYYVATGCTVPIFL